jgi:hypothetical protein
MSQESRTIVELLDIVIDYIEKNIDENNRLYSPEGVMIDGLCTLAIILYDRKILNKSMYLRFMDIIRANPTDKAYHDDPLKSYYFTVSNFTLRLTYLQQLSEKYLGF